MMKYKQIALTYLIAVSSTIVVLSVGIAQAQGKQDVESATVNGATIKGRIAEPDDKQLQVSFDDLNVELLQQVQLAVPPLPSNWDQMKPEERQKWAAEFEASEAGQQLIKRRQELLDAAQHFEIKIEKDGNFVVYDVPPGRYGLRGRFDRKIGERTYAFEVFGQVDVKKEVDELLLDPIMIMATPLIRTGENTPEVSIEAFNGKRLENVHLKGKYVLVNFWAEASPPSVELLPKIQEMYAKMRSSYNNFELLSINIDKDRKKALQFVVDHNIMGWHGYAGDWEHDTVTGFGVRAIPAMFLLGSDGKVLMTHSELMAALGAGNRDLSQIVDDRITGKDKPTDASEESKNASESPERKSPVIK